MKTVVLSVVKILVITSIFFVIYYLLVIKPKNEIPNALSDAEKVISKHYYTLKENRLAITELSRLDSSQANLESQKSEIITKVNETNNRGSEELKEVSVIKRINAVSGQPANFINDKFPETYSELKKTNKELYEDQKLLVDNIVKFDSILTNIFTYDPKEDLKSIEDKTIYLERIESAKNGIAKVKENIIKSDQKNLETGKLITEIDKILELFSNLETQRKENNDNYNKTEDQLFNQYKKVRTAAYSAVIWHIHSQEFIKMLTEETKLISEYEVLTQEINDQR